MNFIEEKNRSMENLFPPDLTIERFVSSIQLTASQPRGIILLGCDANHQETFMRLRDPLFRKEHPRDYFQLYFQALHQPHSWTDAQKKLLEELDAHNQLRRIYTFRMDHQGLDGYPIEYVYGKLEDVFTCQEEKCGMSCTPQEAFTQMERDIPICSYCKKASLVPSISCGDVAVFHSTYYLAHDCRLSDFILMLDCDQDSVVCREAIAQADSESMLIRVQTSPLPTIKVEDVKEYKECIEKVKCLPREDIEKQYDLRAELSSIIENHKRFYMNIENKSETFRTLYVCSTFEQFSEKVLPLLS